MKTSLILLFSYYLLLGCNLNNRKILNNPIEGTYYKEGQKNFYLSFKNDNFYYVENNLSGLAVYTCCDTITHGGFKIDRINNLLYLTTSDYLMNLHLKISVHEKSVENTDSLFFNITNPIEVANLGDREKKPNRLFYRITVNGSDYPLSQIGGNVYDKPNIKIYVPHNIEIENFSIEIYPNYNSLKLRSFNVQYVLTENYKLKNKNAREFNVAIPDLTFSYLSYIRLKKDIVKVISADKLEWDGHMYIR